MGPRSVQTRGGSCVQEVLSRVRTWRMGVASTVCKKSVEG